MQIFVVDFETHIWSSGLENGFDSSNKRNRIPVETNNGIIVYFITEEGQRQQAFLKHEPYFYLKLAPEIDYQTEEGRKRVQKVQKSTFSAGRNGRSELVKKVEVLHLADSDDLLFPEKKLFLKVTVESPRAVPKIRDELERLVDVVEWREADILFHHRAAIDKKINVGKWYSAVVNRGYLLDLQLEEKLEVPELKLVAYDIEVNSPRTRDPSIVKDQVTMISLYSGSNNVVMVNSEVVRTEELKDVMVLIRSKDEEHPLPWVDWQFISDFKENPKPNEFSTPVKVEKHENEKALLRAFIDYLNDEKPDVITDFFGDKFDLPFMAGKSKQLGLDFETITGISFNWKMGAGRDYMKDVESTTLAGPFHLDAFLWNDKYSYLPKKELGLKPSVQRRLKIIPIGRESLWIMEQDPAETVAYSASDGYITWRYAKEIILDFCIAMGRIFPVPSCELLVKRAGSLDDLLVDAIGHERGIVAKKRFTQEGLGRLSDNIVISGIAYTGGAVDAPNPGIWRRDLNREMDINQEKLARVCQVLPSIYEASRKKFLKQTIKTSFEKLLKPYFNSEDHYLDYLKKSGPDDYFEKGIEHLSRENEIPREKIEELLSELKRLEVEGDGLDELVKKIGSLKSGNYKLKGVHCDVTSMYPSQIRQYKIQPSGIVSKDTCQACVHKEPGMVCAFDHDWTLKITAVKPCYYQVGGKTCTARGDECPYNGKEDTCSNYDPGKWKDEKKQEFYCHENGEVICHAITPDLDYKPVDPRKTYLGSGLPKTVDLHETMAKFIREKVKGTEISTNLSRADVSTSGKTHAIIPPENTFLFIESKQKNLSLLVSVKSRICQKAYDFVSDIMNQFFMTRVFHKAETQRLGAYIKTKKSLGEPIPQDLETRRLYHDSTQIGLKVPLNSVYGLLGMKSGVHNASMASAGITTALSSNLITWAVDYLSDIGHVTEYDTDGAWVFIPEEFPDKYTLRIKAHDHGIDERKDFSVLAGLLNHEISERKKNPHYWKNDGKTIELQPKNLLEFEQDGPYDFQMVMGKKKYVVFNKNGDGNWDEKEITGLESKRSDFSLMHKTLQEKIIEAYKSDYGSSTISKLFQNALESASAFIQHIREGKLAEDYYIIPRTITQPLEVYKTILPQVEGALMLRELGYNVEPGMKVDLLLIKSAGKKKSQSVIPKQLFDFPFEDVKKILIKRGIATLGFTFGTIKNKMDLKRMILDTEAYISDLTGEDRLIDRMIVQLARKMNVKLDNIPRNLGIRMKTSNGTNLVKVAMKNSKEPATKSTIEKPTVQLVSNREKTVITGKKVGRVGDETRITHPRRQGPATILDFMPGVKKSTSRKKTMIREGKKKQSKGTRKSSHPEGTGNKAKMTENNFFSSDYNIWEIDTIAAAAATISGRKKTKEFISELFHCTECDLTWELPECDGDKCPICSSTVVYLY
jgi:DNA polymerase elongation subunit (family B)